MTSPGALVTSWLQGIGLNYAVDTFNAAGIETPASLAQLDVSMFEGLGVTNAEDRRKLFFLVQRIKMAVEKQDDSADQVDAVLAQTLGGKRVDEVSSPRPMRRHSDQEEENMHSTGPSRPLPVPEKGVKSPMGRRNRPGTSRSSSSESLSSQDSRSKHRSRRQSGLPGLGSGREPSSRLNPSMRTGKQLSSIPSNSVAPPSPLVDLADTKLSEPQQQKERSQRERSRERSRRRTTSGLLTRSTSPNRSSSSHSRENLRAKSPPPIPNASSTRNGANNSDRRRTMGPKTSSVRVRGKSNGDSSFQTQIASLRQNNDEKFGRSEEPSVEHDMRIRVVVRKRPLFTSERDVDILHPLDCGGFGRLLVYQPKTKVDLTKSVETVPFCFDNVFDEESTNVNIYERTVRGLIPSLLDGKWASIFAYGQTGSGKTFTMMGSPQSDESKYWGLYYLAALDLFQAIQTEGFTDLSLHVSLFEIYNAKLWDLLNDRSPIKCLEDAQGKVCFPNLTEHSVASPDELIDLIEQGNQLRSTGTTSRNLDSSRSHAVLQMHLYEGREEYSRLTFIDLAGSERGADTATASRATRLEGSEINTSLLALKEVIRALATGDASAAHVPFRGSKLTQVLKESFVGEDGRSVMIACVSPNIGNVDTTLNTLRYADRVKERNSETGRLSGAVAAASPLPNRKPQQESQSTRPVMRTPTKSEDDEFFSSHSQSQKSESTDVLDELLASPFPTKSEHTAQSVESMSSNSDLRATADSLIWEHKTAMTTLLAMVKDEMTLVNEADADREGLVVTYAKHLNKLHEEQLDIIERLRERLLNFRMEQLKANEQRTTNLQVVHSDDEGSFEDLRD